LEGNVDEFEDMIDVAGRVRSFCDFNFFERKIIEKRLDDALDVEGIVNVLAKNFIKKKKLCVL
jgi:hypothetical protein